ncbi:MAG: hypothetical protein DHS20C15_09090 [Planctomycetota bacterium]|nr:MAG: hypothetical protein DHS20C15_09090 [Planctomycetota bacterium]
MWIRRLTLPAIAVGLAIALFGGSDNLSDVRVALSEGDVERALGILQRYRGDELIPELAAIVNWQTRGARGKGLAALRRRASEGELYEHGGYPTLVSPLGQHREAPREIVLREPADRPLLLRLEHRGLKLIVAEVPVDVGTQRIDPGVAILAGGQYLATLLEADTQRAVALADFEVLPARHAHDLGLVLAAAHDLAPTPTSAELLVGVACMAFGNFEEAEQRLARAALDEDMQPAATELRALALDALGLDHSALHLLAQREDSNAWLPLFNGRDLTGWTPKIVGQPAGLNFANTFRVRDGLLAVSYADYDGDFGERFGHLFHNGHFSNYRLRVEYRFVGEQMQGGPGWAWANSGVMLHGQSAHSMTLEQDFPVSLEVQLLAGDGANERPTANLCTPGTHVVRAGELLTQHCTNSSSATYPRERWVTLEVEVRGGELIEHSIDGEVVMSYREPQLDPGDANAARLRRGDSLLLTGGTISLQSESHPIEFRKIELLLR